MPTLNACNISLCKKSTSPAISVVLLQNKTPFYRQNTILYAKLIINQKNSRLNSNWTGLITNAPRMKKESILTWNGFTSLTITDIWTEKPFWHWGSLEWPSRGCSLGQSIIPRLPSTVILLFTPDECQPMSTPLPAPFISNCCLHQETNSTPF